MKRSQIILSLIGVVAVVFLYFLPKSVVENEKDGLVGTVISTDNEEQSVTAEHLNLSQERVEEINSLREATQSSVNKEKSAIFADSLATAFESANLFDSAATYRAGIANDFPSVTNLEKAGDTYYQAFNFAIDAKRQEYLGERARFYYENVLREDPLKLDSKTNLAMTLASSSNPMQGIMKLREVLESDPEHQGALFNMGLLSMQSGQYKKAIDRFEKLTGLYPDNLQAQFLLGASYFEDGQKEKAVVQLEKVKGMDGDLTVLEAVNNYLEEIK